MIDYKGSLCPVCQTKFQRDDDIVVCPECGTPYHRACWQKAGACLHQAEHAAGFEWKPDFSPESAEAVCPNCGTHNPAGAQFCNHCGVPLPTHPDAPGAKGEAARPIYDRQPGGYRPPRGNGPQPDLVDEQKVLRSELHPDDKINGVCAKDILQYTGPNGRQSGMYYLVQFMRIAYHPHGFPLSFSAFLLGPYYFFYRKMWRQGILFAALDFLLSVPTFLYLLKISQTAWLASASMSWLPLVMNICYGLSWLMMMVRGLGSLRWYKRLVTENILSIYEQYPQDDENRTNALITTGGTSILAVVIYFLVCVLLGVGLFYLMGPNLSAVMRALAL